MLHLDYRDIRPIYAQITDEVRQQIAAGVLVQGDKLPSVRELAVELSINPNTIQRAYRAGDGGLDRYGARQGLLRLRAAYGGSSGGAEAAAGLRGHGKKALVYGLYASGAGTKVDGGNGSCLK